MDQMGNGVDTLRKIYVLELRQPFNPSCLVSNPSVTGIDLNPLAAGACAGATAAVTARIHNQANQPIPGVLVTFAVVSGPNAGAQATEVYNPATRLSDANGQVTFTYTSNGGLGDDVINASFVNSSGQPIISSASHVIWSCCTPPTIVATAAANRGYYLLAAGAGCLGSGGGSLQVYVKDSASAFVAGPFASGTVVKIKRSIATGIGPASGPASVTINVRGDGQAYSQDPVGDMSPPVTCRSL